jgi:hypothetical protein
LSAILPNERHPRWLMATIRSSAHDACPDGCHAPSVAYERPVPVRV